MKNPVQSSPPKSHGFLRAIWSVWTPDRFESIRPTFRGLSYRMRRQRGIKPRVDVYMPDGLGPHPSVILIHGGGFLIGSRDMKPARFLASELVKAGFVVASMDYRMVLRGGRFDESKEDVETMTSWWFSHAKTYMLDPKNISMLGISAGAALMLMAAGSKESSPVARFVSVYGIYDFEHLGGRLLKILRRKLFRSREPAVWRKYSPLHQFEREESLLVIHGTADSIVPVEQADKLIEKRRLSGLPAEYVRCDKAPHGFFNDAQTRHSKDALNRLLEFLQRPVTETS